MKLIFVDDSIIWREVLCEIADAVGMTSTSYAFPQEVDTDMVQDADVIVTDNKFGSRGYLGVDFIRAIRASGYSGCVILYTNHPRQGDLRDIAELNGRVVEKSVAPETLVQSLCRL